MANPGFKSGIFCVISHVVGAVVAVWLASGAKLCLDNAKIAMRASLHGTLDVAPVSNCNELTDTISQSKVLLMVPRLWFGR